MQPYLVRRQALDFQLPVPYMRPKDAYTGPEGMSDSVPGPYPTKLTRAAAYLAEQLEEYGKPVLTQFDFFKQIVRMYRGSSAKKLYLRHELPGEAERVRLRLILRNAGVLGPDRDYGGRVVRVLTVPDLPAEDIICLVDRTCHVSHLSAMQRWGLTDRSPNALILTRPDRESAAAQLHARMAELPAAGEVDCPVLKVIKHPARVRRRTVHVHETKAPSEFLRNRGDEVRLSTIGQTFLDMLRRPDLCGGMSHVLDVWEENAETYLEEIVAAVDVSSSRLVKSRAGYIIEERLGLHHRAVEPWKALGQRGGSRKLDPARDFSPEFSETWMISLNV